MMIRLALASIFLYSLSNAQSVPGSWYGRGFSTKLIAPYPTGIKNGSRSSIVRSSVANKVPAKNLLNNDSSENCYIGAASTCLRGGDKLPVATTNILDQTVSITMQVITTACRTILPAIVGTAKIIIGFYAILPIDATLAQAGLVYCFAGGYFPTLFAAVQAAKRCGLEVMIAAVGDLTDEAVAAVKACNFQPSRGFFPDGESSRKAHEIFTEKTKIILATIDPMKINQAVAALYTTWMGVSTVLEREFARTITLSVTIADCMRPTVCFILGPPIYRCVPSQYHKWIPIVLGWGCKAAAMSVAWRVQRVLTAYTSAIAGGLMFSRSCVRMLRKRGIHLFGLIPENCDRSVLDELIGFTVAGFGLYSQIGDGFDFKIPFPVNLVTWPFSLAEHWIQWQITKGAKEERR